MSRRRRGWLARLVLLAAGGGALGGCSGSGQIELISLNFRAIDPPNPRAMRFGLQECYWWEDDEGGLHIAIRRETRLWIGPIQELLFQAAFTLERLPRGKARNYDLKADSFQASAVAGPAIVRYTARTGIAAVYREGEDRIRGSFRVRVLREVTQLLGGWSKPSEQMIQGSFEAVRDASRGGRITSALTANESQEPDPDLPEPAEAAVGPEAE